MIHIVYGIEDLTGEFYEYLGLSMFSVMKNTNEDLTFHIIHGTGFSQTSKEQLDKLCAANGAEVRFYSVVPKPWMNSPDVYGTAYTEGMFYRLYIPELLSELDKVIYLDTDIVVNGDIAELWMQPLEGKSIAGVWDMPVDHSLEKQDLFGPATRAAVDLFDYINTGVLLMDVKKIFAGHDLVAEVSVFLKKYGYDFPDQDALNYIFAGDIRLLPGHFNRMVTESCPVEWGVIYHYLLRPWNFSGKDPDPVTRLVLSLWKELPWYRPEYSMQERIAYAGRWKSKSAAYEKLKTFGPLPPRRESDYITSLYQDGDFSGCLGEYMKEKDRLDGESAIYYAAQACIQMDMNDTAFDLLDGKLVPRKGARICLEKEGLHEVRMWILRGDILLKKHDYRGAAESYRQSLWFRRQPDTNLIYMALCRMELCYKLLGDRNAAEECGIRANALDPERYKNEKKIVMSTLSVCMIVKNEEAVLDRCLEHIRDFADELIIVDTGSSDATKEIAAKYTDKIFDFPWCDDFAAARNYAFSKAGSDYIMWLDADDVIDAKNADVIRSLKYRIRGRDAVLMNYYRPENDALISHIRMVRRCPQIRWEGRIHERLTGIRSGVNTDIVIRHEKAGPYDYTRNIRIMQQLDRGELCKDFWLSAQCFLDCALADETELAAEYLSCAGKAGPTLSADHATFTLIGNALLRNEKKEMLRAWNELFLTAALADKGEKNLRLIFPGKTNLKTRMKNIISYCRNCAEYTEDPRMNEIADGLENAEEACHE